MWAAVFPGQGSQFVGMGQFLYDEFSIVRNLFEEASDTLKIDFKKLCFTSSEEELARTENTQPALLLNSTLTYRVLAEVAPVKVQAAAGHSIGEYAALVNAGVLKFTDALLAVRKRGEFMQSAVPAGQGAMAAVMGLDTAQVLALCSWATAGSGLGPLEPANYNAPGQIVISGSAGTLAWAGQHFAENAFMGAPKRLKMIPLKVSAPFHCSLMKPAEERMRLVLSDVAFSTPKYPIVQNFVAEAISDSSQLRENLIRQISGPVRWVECVQKLTHMGISKVIEFGSSKVISGLVKKIDSEKLQTFNITSMEELKGLEQQLLNS